MIDSATAKPTTTFRALTHLNLAAKPFPAYEQRTDISMSFCKKNHDFGLNVDVGESVGVVVQVRNPISVIFSYFEFSVKHGHINNTEEDFINFAAKTSRFYIKFWNRWVTDEKNHVILYEQLTSNTARTLRNFFSWAEVSVTDSSICGAIEERANVQAHGGKEIYKAPKLESHRYWDEAFVYRTYAEISQSCIGFGEYYTPDVLGRHAGYDLPTFLLSLKREQIEEIVSGNGLSPERITSAVVQGCEALRALSSQRVEILQLLEERDALAMERDQTQKQLAGVIKYPWKHFGKFLARRW